MAGIAALRHLAATGELDNRARGIARAIVDSPRRIACHGGWRAFTGDEEIRAAAAKLLG
jgi:hypothetical protein